MLIVASNPLIIFHQRIVLNALGSEYLTHIIDYNDSCWNTFVQS